MKYFEMFAGIGGFRLGIESAWNKSRGDVQGKEREYSERLELHTEGEYKKIYTDSEPICIGFSEIDKYAIQIYKNHFKGTNKGTRNYGDANFIIPEELPDFDFLVGGFPCQAFSMAGKRGGFNDTRGTLFFEIARILRDKGPRYFLLENVKGLLSHDGGKTFQTILKVLSDMGYRVEWQVLNSKNHGVPQNRERIFIFGTRGGSGRKIFPLRESGKFVDGEIRQGDDIAHTITNSEKHRGSYIVAWSKSHRTGKTDADKRRKNYGQVEHRVKYGEANTISTGEGGGNQSTQNFVVGAQRIRRLTPTECERLQGFPDGWTEGISDTQRYKCLGNAVTVNVVQAIVEKMITIFGE